MEQSTTILNSAFASFNIVVLCSIKPHIDLVQVQYLYSITAQPVRLSETKYTTMYIVCNSHMIMFRLLSTHLERDQLWIADNECTSDNVCKKNCGAVTCILYTLYISYKITF
jgi:hypothetical protein